MKKIIMSVIGLALALALVVSVWVPIASRGKTRGVSNQAEIDSINTSISTLK